MVALVERRLNKYSDSYNGIQLFNVEMKDSIGVKIFEDDLRLRSIVTALEIGATMLLLEAWHVNTAWRWRRLNFSSRNIF